MVSFIAISEGRVDGCCMRCIFRRTASLVKGVRCAWNSTAHKHADNDAFVLL